MREGRTITIKEILVEIEETKRQEIITTFNSAMTKICANELDWQNFEVFVPGMELMRIILESNSPEYFMLAVDAILSRMDDSLAKVVKFVIKRAKNSDNNSYKINSDTVIVQISLSTRDFKKLVSEID